MDRNSLRYRARAVEWEQRARTETDPELQRAYAEFARSWLFLYEQYEKRPWTPHGKT